MGVRTHTTQRGGCDEEAVDHRGLMSYWYILMLSLFQIDFVDAKNGYIAGGDNGVGANSLRSTDGGNTWTSLQISPAMMLLAVSTASAESAAITGIGLLAGANQYTTDGQVFHNSSEPHVILQQTQDMSTIGDGVGFASAGQFTFVKQPATNGVAISKDAGRTYTFSDVGGDPNVPARYSSFPSEQVGFVTSGTWPSSGNKKYGKYLSRNIHLHDNVATKEAYLHFTSKADKKQSLKAHNKKGRHGKHGKQGKISAPETTPWAAAIFRSTDGFQTWQQVFTNSSQSRECNTKARGQNCLQLRVHSPVMFSFQPLAYYMNQISCPSEQVCFAVAENDDSGFGLRTTDGGNTWETMFEAPGVSMISAYAQDENNFWLGGGILAETGVNGTVFSSTDGGNTITTTNMYVNTPAGGVEMLKSCS